MRDSKPQEGAFPEIFGTSPDSGITPPEYFQISSLGSATMSNAPARSDANHPWTLASFSTSNWIVRPDLSTIRNDLSRGMAVGDNPENEELKLLNEHRDLFERLARSDLPISEDAARGLAYLDAEAEQDG